MKTILLLLCLLSFGTALNAGTPKKTGLVHVIYKRMDVFYAKVDKEFLGAEVDIYSADGLKLSTQKIDHRRVLIDFYYENDGNYVIVFKKGDIEETFDFVKVDGSHQQEGSPRTVAIVQGI